jgi:hypothetical protein
MDPWGWINDYLIHPPNELNFTIPTLILASGLGAIPAYFFDPPCVPHDRGPQRFYDALSGPIWMLNATQCNLFQN